MNELSNGILIELDNGKKYHTLDDWGLALGNNNYIAEPEQETWYINVPYKSGLIDLSESISGRRVFKQRGLAFSLGGKRQRHGWDTTISEMRNAIHGQKCKLTLDNDKEHYWVGRVYITEFDRFRDLGTFTLSVPQADPYKYNVLQSTDPWLWDPFNFQTGVIQSIGEITVNGTKNLTIPYGYMLIAPTFVCTNVNNLTVTQNGRVYNLNNGSNRFPSLLVNGDETTLTFNGIGNVTVVYRGGSL